MKLIICTTASVLIFVTISLISIADAGDLDERSKGYTTYHPGPTICRLLRKNPHTSYQKLRKHCHSYLNLRYRSRGRSHQQDQFSDERLSSLLESDGGRSSPKYPRALRDDRQQAVTSGSRLKPEYGLIMRLTAALQRRYQRSDNDLGSEEVPDVASATDSAAVQNVVKESAQDHYYDNSGPLYIIRKWYNGMTSD